MIDPRTLAKQIKDTIQGTAGGLTTYRYIEPDLEALVDALVTCEISRQQLIRGSEHMTRELISAKAERNSWLVWSDGLYPDDSPGDVIAAEFDGTITLDDGITTWNPLRALAFFHQQNERREGGEK